MHYINCNTHSPITRISHNKSKLIVDRFDDYDCTQKDSHNHVKDSIISYF